MNVKALSPKGVFALLKETYTEWSKDKCMRLAAALAYYSIFSIAPLMLITIGVVGAIYGDEAAQGEVSKQLGKVMGPQMAKSLEDMVKSAGENSRGASVVGVVTLLVGASTVFGQLKEALNTIWEVRPREGLGIMGFIKGRIMTFGIVLVIGFLMLVSLLLTTVVAAFNGYIEQAFGIPPVLSGILGFLVPLAIEVVLFATLFKLLPDAQVKWTNVWMGALVTALLFEIGKTILSWYLGRASTTSSFGAAGSLVLILLWVYYSSLILFFGAEFTEVYARATGHVIQPKPNAVSVTPRERAEEGLDPEIVPHPSAAAAMAGRDPNTGSKEGDERAAYASPEAESQTSPLRPDGPSPSKPRKERLAPLIAEADEDRFGDLTMGEPTVHSVGPTPSLIDRVHANPIAEMGAAIGVGLVLGIISRLADRRRDVGATEHLRLGTKAAALAGAAMLAKAGADLRRNVTPAKIRRAAGHAATRVRDEGARLARKME